MTNKLGVVYGLMCPMSKELRYIGSTIAGIKSRLWAHKRESNIITKVSEWVSEVRNNNLIDKIEYVIIENYIPEAILKERENAWIKQFALLGCNLTNSMNAMLPYEKRSKPGATQIRDAVIKGPAEDFILNIQVDYILMGKTINRGEALNLLLNDREKLIALREVLLKNKAA